MARRLLEQLQRLWRNVHDTPWLLPVIAVWALATGVTLASVFASSLRLPWADDWSFMPHTVGDEPVTPSWLWADHNGHHVPLMKGLHVATLRMTGLDYRAPTVAITLALSALVLAIVVSRRTRRAPHPLADMAVIALVLNPMHGPYRWGFQAQFAGSAAALLVLILADARSIPIHSRRGHFAVAIAAALALGSGANGAVVLVVITFALAVAWFGDRQRRSHVTAALGLLCALGAVAALWGNLASEATATVASPVHVAKFALHLISSGFGSTADRYWPLPLIAVVALGLASARQILGKPFALLTVACAGAVIAAVTYGRGGELWGDSSHYGFLVTPLLVTLLLHLPERPVTARIASAMGAVAMVFLYLLASDQTMRAGPSIRARERAFLNDAADGLSVSELVDAHASTLFFEHEGARRFLQLRLPGYLRYLGYEATSPARVSACC